MRVLDQSIAGSHDIVRINTTNASVPNSLIERIFNAATSGKKEAPINR